MVGLIQSDWYPSKRKPGHTERQQGYVITGGPPCEEAARGDTCKSMTEASEGPHPMTHWSGTCGLQKSEKSNFSP